jgi:hypothetical protein
MHLWRNGVCLKNVILLSITPLQTWKQPGSPMLLLLMISAFLDKTFLPNVLVMEEELAVGRTVGGSP